MLAWFKALFAATEAEPRKSELAHKITTNARGLFDNLVDDLQHASELLREDIDDAHTEAQAAKVYEAEAVARQYADEVVTATDARIASATAAAVSNAQVITAVTTLPGSTSTDK